MRMRSSTPYCVPACGARSFGDLLRIIAWAGTGFEGPQAPEAQARNAGSEAGIGDEIFPAALPRYCYS